MSILHLNQSAIDSREYGPSNQSPADSSVSRSPADLVELSPKKSLFIFETFIYLDVIYMHEL